MTTQVNPISFNFESSVAIRVILINFEPWFIAVDVCNALKLSNPTEVIRRLDEDEKKTLNLYSTYFKMHPPIQQKARIVSLSRGLAVHLEVY